MSDAPQPVDLTKSANVTMSLGHWNGLLACLRTGKGDAFTWEATNPLILMISQQLQSQMYPQQHTQQPLPTVVTAAKPKPNGEDTNTSLLNAPRASATSY